jgi:two-component system response regulator AtoC
MKVQRILIVDDDFASRVAMEKVLQSRGYKTCSCDSGEDAILVLKRQFFDTLITDFQMSGISGFEVIKKAREIHPEIFTILVSGHVIEKMRARLAEESVNGFFPKPIEWDDLINFLNNLPGQSLHGKRII